MDEVPIATANPVKISVAPIAKKKIESKTVGTFKNFFYMMPLAIILLIQGFFFGKLVGKYSTFPILSVTTYILVAKIVVILLLVHIFIRSIAYSTGFCILLLCGIYYALFGNFTVPIAENFKGMIGVLKSAWTSRHIPYPILMSTLLTGGILVAMIGNFIFSLLVKYFFEVVFGNEWSDGKRYGFISAIVLIAIVQIAMGGFQVGKGELSRVVWEHRDLYNPLEEYISRIPTGVQYSDSHVWAFDKAHITAYNLSSGKLIRENKVGATIPITTFGKATNPVLPTEKGLVCFDRDLLAELWTCPFPFKLPTTCTDSVELPAGMPYYLRTDISTSLILACLPMGYWAAVDRESGKVLWIRALDQKYSYNALHLESNIRSAHIVKCGMALFFSGDKGRITAIEERTGKILWEFNHKETQFAGRGQRAFLSSYGMKIMAAFPSGSLVALDAKKGTVLDEASHQNWNPATAACWDGDEVGFISGHGNYIRAQIDGGRVLMDVQVIDTSIPLMPVGVDLAAGLIGFQENLYLVATRTQKIQTIFRSPRRAISTKPELGHPFIYFGTQDGWVHCIHNASFDLKWAVNVGGELPEESLALTEEGLLVRTSAGSLVLLRPGDD